MFGGGPAYTGRSRRFDIPRQILGFQAKVLGVHARPQIFQKWILLLPRGLFVPSAQNGRTAVKPISLIDVLINLSAVQFSRCGRKRSVTPLRRNHPERGCVWDLRFHRHTKQSHPFRIWMVWQLTGRVPSGLKDTPALPPRCGPPGAAGILCVRLRAHDRDRANPDP